MRPGSPALGAASALALALVAIALSADFLSPSPPSTHNLEMPYAPPTRVHWIDTAGRFHLRPFVHRYELVDPLNLRYQERTDAAYPLEFFARAWDYRFAGLIPASRHLIQAGSGGNLFLLGADELGRDVLARTLAGARTSLTVVLVGIVIYAAVGLAIGGLAGMLGGWIDHGLMRFSEFVLALPALYLILALRALLPQGTPYWQTLLVTVGTIALVAWPPMARGIRGLLLQLRSSPYVEAARGLGGTPWQIFSRHMLRELAPFALTQTALAAPIFIMGEVLLSYLGVGFQDTDASWGTMLQKAQDVRVVTDFWWNLAPLPLVFAALLCLNVAAVRGLGRDTARITL
ncbi:MAG: ABC transporter permease [Acidobacteria bacterium]|nr:MAG: ABC transporter permease [Acidobacteriota bacterium]